MARRRTISSTPEQAFQSPSFISFVVTFTLLVIVLLAAAVLAGNAGVGDHFLVSKTLLLAHSLFLTCLLTLMVDFWRIRRALQRVDRSWLEATIDHEELIPSPRPVVTAVQELLDRGYQGWTGRWCLLFFAAIPISLFGLVAYLTAPLRETGTSLPYEVLFVPVGEFLVAVTLICLFAALVRSQCDRAQVKASNDVELLYSTGRLSSFSDVGAQTAEMQMAAAAAAAGVKSTSSPFGNDGYDGNRVATNPFGNDGVVSAENPPGGSVNPFQRDDASDSPTKRNRVPDGRNPFGD